MKSITPRYEVPPAPAGWRAMTGLPDLLWEAIPPLPPLRRTEDGTAPEQPTLVRLCSDAVALYVRFDCTDRDAWSTYRQRNDPIYEEEVVEVFLAPGEPDPGRYWEFEVSPAGVGFAARIHNPQRERAGLEIGLAWDCPGLRWHAGPGTARQDWWAAFALPWALLAPVSPEGVPPPVWRGNFYRIERPRDGKPEWSAWSPTLVSPPDFHRPDRFGTLLVVAAES
ncbi:MAG: carbohydrate-binding family 9-like protein [Acidobacteriota bacterium]|nr:carbohydrate-binding family 9-like protein [Acidobacteriota bacterium]